MYGRARYSQARGGLRIGRFLGNLARGAARAAVGVVSGGLTSAIPSVLPGGIPSLGTSFAGPGRGRRPEGGVTGAVHRLVPGGHTGYVGGRRMNAGNAKAARRAIRRIKAVRKLLVSIERELPRRPAKASYGSRGVITRREAAGALAR